MQGCNVHAGALGHGAGTQSLETSLRNRVKSGLEQRGAALARVIGRLEQSSGPARNGTINQSIGHGSRIATNHLIVNQLIE